MKYLILFTVSALGLMQTACEMKIASDNQITANISAPNSSVFGGLPAGPTAATPTAPAATPTAVPIGVTTLPSGTPAGTTPMVPIKVASINLTDAEKTNAVRTSILNTFSRAPASTFGLARTPSPIKAPATTATKPAILKTAAVEIEPSIADNRVTKVSVQHSVESAR